ncbi:MAG: hypothetical protein IT215_07045 [Chitinophagaceae bacterium]|nr:hypothetical protein [Chitinophagaceae bacterium]
MKIKRVCIYPKDIQCITGKSERYSQKLFKKIKEHYGKNQDQFLTINEFCEYTSIDKPTVENFIFD